MYRDDESSDFGFIDSVLVFLVSLGLTLVLLWIVSRILGLPWFEHLPDWLTSGLGKILVGLFSCGSLATIVIKKIASEHTPDFFWRICGTTGVLFVIILLLVVVLRPRESAAKPQSAVVNPSGGNAQPLPAPKKELHKTDERGSEYIARWSARGNCREALQDPTHQCIFHTVRRHIGASADGFDHWELILTLPGPPYDVQCELGINQLKENDTPGNGPGTTTGDSAICSGWINGAEDYIKMTVKYQVLR